MTELTKTPESYSEEFSLRDYVINGELTVTITLAEYRNLVAAKAASDARISNLYSENNRLQKELREAANA